MRPTGAGSSVSRPSFRRPRLSPSTRRMLITAGVIAAIAIVIFGSSAFWVNWWWFGSMGHREVLTTRYTAQVVSFVLGAALTVAVFGGNMVLALRRSREVQANGRMITLANRTLQAAGIAATGILALFFGLAAAGRWQTWLLWLHGGDFGIRDPVFHRDVGFFVFALPALHSIEKGAFALLAATIVAVAVVYVV